MSQRQMFNWMSLQTDRQITVTVDHPQCNLSKCWPAFRVFHHC